MMWRNVNSRPMRPGMSVWQDMRRWQRDMDYLLGGTWGPVRAKYPAINAWVSDEGAVATAEIPGVDPEAINISVVGNTLTLSGTRNEEELPKDAHYYRRERGQGEFTRTIELSFQVDAEKVEAHFRNGVLYINLPRVPEEKPRKIAVVSE